METFSTIIESITPIAWPIVLLCLGLFFLLIYKAPITGFLNRSDKAKIGNFAADAPINQTQTASNNINNLGKLEQLTKSEPGYQNIEKDDNTEKDGVVAYLASFDNPLIKETEKIISENLKSRNITDAAGRERFLIRELASTQMIVFMERVYAEIWASQVAALRSLNSCHGGVDVSILKNFYDTAKANYPDLYKDMKLESWQHYLTLFNLIQLDGSKVVITMAGQQFLKYLIEARKQERVFG